MVVDLLSFSVSYKNVFTLHIRILIGSQGECQYKRQILL